MIPSILMKLIRDDEASSLIESALILPPLLLLMVGGIDLGRGSYAAIEVGSAAEAGAIYGTQNPKDTTGIKNAAIADAADVVNVVPTVTYGCECSDGTSITPNCTSAPTCTTVVQYVEVDTQASYTPIINYPGLTFPLVLKGSARLRAGY